MLVQNSEDLDSTDLWLRPLLIDPLRQCRTNSLWCRFALTKIEKISYEFALLGAHQNIAAHSLPDTALRSDNEQWRKLCYPNLLTVDIND